MKGCDKFAAFFLFCDNKFLTLYYNLFTQTKLTNL